MSRRYRLARHASAGTWHPLRFLYRRRFLGRAADSALEVEVGAVKAAHAQAAPGPEALRVPLRVHASAHGKAMSRRSGRSLARSHDCGM